MSSLNDEFVRKERNRSTDNHYILRILKARLVLKIISGTSSTSNFIVADNTHTPELNAGK